MSQTAIGNEQDSLPRPAYIDVPDAEAITLDAAAPSSELPPVADCSSELSETPRRKRKRPANFEPLPASAKQPAPAVSTRPRATRRTDGGFDPDLQWLIQSGDEALGMTGTLAGVVSQIERGSVGGSGRLDDSGAFKHPYTDLQLGAGSDGIGEVERHRRLMAAWIRVSPAAQMRLCLRYRAVPARFRSDSGFGAKDRWVEGSDHREGQHGMQRYSVEDRLGAFAALAFELCADPIKLLIACMEPDPVWKGKTNKSEQKRRADLVRDCLARAHAADRADHDEWFAAKAIVPGLRTFKDRTGRARNQTMDAVLPLMPARVATNASRRRTGIKVDDATFERAVAETLAAAQAVAAE